MSLTGLWGGRTCCFSRELDTAAVGSVNAARYLCATDTSVATEIGVESLCAFLDPATAPDRRRIDSKQGSPAQPRVAWLGGGEPAFIDLGVSRSSERYSNDRKEDDSFRVTSTRPAADRPRATAVSILETIPRRYRYFLCSSIILIARSSGRSKLGVFGQRR